MTGHERIGPAVTSGRGRSGRRAPMGGLHAGPDFPYGLTAASRTAKKGPAEARPERGTLSGAAFCDAGRGATGEIVVNGAGYPLASGSCYGASILSLLAARM
jgi:hypothetical protein